jgi:hypothetical protein
MSHYYQNLGLFSAISLPFIPLFYASISNTNKIIGSEDVALREQLKSGYILEDSQRYLNLRKLILHTYHSRFIPERVAEASQILLQDANVLPKLLSCEEYCRRDKW